MLKIKEIKAKSIIVKTNLPEGDFVINPYVGCSHGCKYCYARFMKRFTNHPEPWGEFVDVKINASVLIPDKTDKYQNKSITFGSVTDAYQPIERKYQLTRKILKKLIPLNVNIDIITKSDLVVRDLDLLKQFKDCLVAFSICTLDDQIRKKLEPGASSIEKRIASLKILHKDKIKTAVFISPLLPYLTDWKAIINITKKFTHEFWFENLNLYPSIRTNIFGFLRQNYPDLVNKYQEIYPSTRSDKSDRYGVSLPYRVDRCPLRQIGGELHFKSNNYWQQTEEEIRHFCKINHLKYKIYFHHKRGG